MFEPGAIFVCEREADRISTRHLRRFRPGDVFTVISSQKGGSQISVMHHEDSLLKKIIVTQNLHPGGFREKELSQFMRRIV